MPKSNSYKSYKVNLTKTIVENQVHLQKNKVSVELHSQHKISNLKKFELPQLYVVRTISNDHLAKLASRIERHAQFSIINTASDFLNKSKELKLLNCLYEDVAYINHLRNLHWIDVSEHLYCGRQSEKTVHNHTIADIKAITANLLKENDDLLAKTLWSIQDHYNQKAHKIAIKLMQHKVQIYLNQQAEDETKPKTKAKASVVVESPLIKEKFQLETLVKLDINKLTLVKLFALYKFLQAQTFNYENFSNLKKWDKQKTIKNLQQKIHDKFLKYNPNNLCDALNARYTVLKEKLDQQFALSTERIKDQFLVTKAQINEYDKNNLEHEEEIYWWNYAEIYKSGNSKLNKNIALQNLYVKNLFWKIQEHNTQSPNQIELRDLPGLIHPLHFTSEIKLNLVNFEDKMRIANEKMMDDPSLAIQIVNGDSKLQDLKAMKILSKFKSFKSFQSRVAVLRELSLIKYESALQSNNRRYQKAKAGLMLATEAKIKNIEKISHDVKTVKQLLQLHENVANEAKNKIEIEK